MPMNRSTFTPKSQENKNSNYQSLFYLEETKNLVGRLEMLWVVKRYVR